MKAHFIYGPPGTGKTTALVSIVARAVERGYRPFDIVLLSHTRAAAREAGARTGMPAENMSTLHSLAFRMLGLSRSQVVDFSKLRDFSELVNVPIKGGDINSDEGIEIGDEYLGVINLAASLMRPIDEVYDTMNRPGQPAEFKMFHTAYGKWKESKGFLDFNDMLVRYNSDFRPINAPVLMVDETQDLSPLQWSIIRQLAQGAKLVYMAGDDDQAIYVWGGADAHGMATYHTLWGGQIKVLAQSYRVPRAVHAMAQNVVSRIKQRHTKEYAPRDADGGINRYGDIGHIEIDKRQTMILYRNHSVRKGIEEWLMSRHILYRTVSGRPGPLDSKYGKGIAAVNKATAGGELDAADRRAIEAVATAAGKKLLANDDSKEIGRAGWRKVVALPDFLYDYYSGVDFNTAIDVQLGSIHSSKGKEADRVILHTGMTNRTEQGMDADPDSEARVWYVAITRAKEQLDIIDGGGYPL
jgi:DNA helicase-2/ATP-dependent DNA helicase PcrA